jgi:hypothetical protein
MLYHFTDEREAIRVEARGRQSDEDIARINVGSRKKSLALDCANCEACCVVFVWTKQDLVLGETSESEELLLTSIVQARHLSRFSSH